MPHLAAYEEASTDLEMALAAIECSRTLKRLGLKMPKNFLAKNAKIRAWDWAETAARHAQAIGVKDAEELLGGEGWPQLFDLENRLQALKGNMTTIVTNAFSINMLEAKRQEIDFKPLTVDEAREFLLEGPFETAVGHGDTSAILTAHVGVLIQANRVNVEFIPHATRLIVGQYRGPRLEEGTTELPEGATIQWWLVV